MPATQAIIDFVTVAARKVERKDETVKTAHAGARDGAVDGYLANLADATTENNRIFDFYKDGRVIFLFTSDKSQLSAPLVAGATYAPILPGSLWGFDGTKPVICVNPDETADTVTWEGIA